MRKDIQKMTANQHNSPHGTKKDRKKIRKITKNKNDYLGRYGPGESQRSQSCSPAVAGSLSNYGPGEIIVLHPGKSTTLIEFQSRRAGLSFR